VAIVQRVVALVDALLVDALPLRGRGKLQVASQISPNVCAKICVRISRPLCATSPKFPLATSISTRRRKATLTLVDSGHQAAISKAT
jgi:hypothetical protein